MKVFIDANILVTVLNKAYPLFPYAARVLSLAGHPRFTLYTSPLCLAIAFYFAEKKSGKSHARKKMTLPAEKLAIAGLSATAVSRTLLNKYRTWKMDLNIMGRRGWLQLYVTETAGTFISAAWKRFRRNNFFKNTW